MALQRCDALTRSPAAEIAVGPTAPIGPKLRQDYVGRDSGFETLIYGRRIYRYMYGGYIRDGPPLSRSENCLEKHNPPDMQATLTTQVLCNDSSYARTHEHIYTHAQNRAR